MDSKFIILTISLFLAIYAMSMMSKNKEAVKIDDILDPILEEPENRKVVVSDEDVVKTVNIGNVLNRKTSNNTVYGTRKSKIIKETDSAGGFNYGYLEGIIKKNSEWGKSGPNEKSYEKKSDIQPKYLYGLNRHKNIMYFDKHFVDDSEQPTEDVTTTAVEERYKHMNAALNQLGNAIANSDKNNINLDGPESKKLLTFAKSKILAPSFSYGYLDAKDPISLKSGKPFNKDLPHDVTKGIENFTNQVKFNNDNKIIYKII